ncbi:AsmA family protein [Pedobacter sp. PLR]|uniref:AsmA family protein n=1 Tax=Pedobacter sp. PLR TaxID=2994465 RepID=UPI002247DF94|nr:AsmA family protein [Pedobacter sp. PLR]MCX2452216.1 AsmA family protein [Pedobacter sp. PLR]
MEKMPRWSKIALRIFIGLVAFVALIFTGLGLYVNANKKTLLATITEQLNKNLNGSLTIGSMDPTFFKGFPGVSISLRNVVIKDSLWKVHQHTLLEAQDFEVSVNTMALLRGTIEIKKIGISNAKIDLYTDTAGYSNTAVFRKKDKKKPKEDKGSTDAQLKEFSLYNVNFIVDNRKGHKLFHFEVEALKGKMDYSFSGWEAQLKLKTLAKSMAFNTRRGSFIKDKVLEGPFKVNFDEDTGVLLVAPNQLNIGKDPFMIGARFDTSKENTDFAIDIKAPSILWIDAANLLAPNITEKLVMFDLKKPIDVTCTLKGDMGPGGDPEINVMALVKDNILKTPGAVIDSCNFKGVFTNNYEQGKGFTDANSAIKLYQFKGAYTEMPFSIDTVFIHNLDKPIATGVFKSKFSVAKLNKAIGTETLRFGKGTATVKLAYKADIVDFKLHKPLVTGVIDVVNADVSYVPRKLNFTNTAVSLNFTTDDLFIKNIRLQSGKSIVLMDGHIRNFLNLYYNDPAKILLNWQIRSPQLHLGEFLGFLGSRKPARAAKKNAKNTSFSEDVNDLFEKSKVDMHLRVAKVYYNKFTGTDVTADLFLSEAGIGLKNISVKQGNGSMKVNGNISQKGNHNRFLVNTTLNNVDVKSFFYSFDNFGMTTLTSKNLKGYLFSKSTIGGLVTDQGKLVTSSLNGDISFDLKQGALLKFEPIISVGKFAFPFRDLDNITFSNLNGKFDVRGPMITINPMQINSSILNMDVAGVYSMSKGTNIAVDVPLRNPKKDADITDKKEIQERRMKGIVLHLLATDGEDGKIKIKLNKNKNKGK